MDVHKILQKYPIISDQMTRERLRVVLRELEKVLQAETPGDVVEFGCYIGTTSLFIRRLLNLHKKLSDRTKNCASFLGEFHVYDSFEGLPEKSEQDLSRAGEQFKAGEISASKKQFLLEFQKAGLKPPITHKGWFKNLTPKDVPEQIAFAYMDGDFYDSILDSLRLIWPKLAPNAVVTVDDFGREALPGAERAVRYFLKDKKYKILRAEHNIAVITLN